MIYPVVILQLILSYLNLEDIPEKYYDIILIVQSLHKNIKNIYKFKSCKEIYLPFNKYIDDKYIKFLPKGLTHLQLKFNTNLTNECIKFLPRSLIWLDLFYNTNLTNILDFPKSLQYIDLLTNSKINKKLLKNKLPNCNTIY
jgi:hypothetical protein